MIETIVIVLLVALDQVVKYLVRTGIDLFQQIPVIPGFLGLTYIQNPGAAFSMLIGARWFFVVLTVAVVGAALYVLWTKKITHPFGRWTLAVVIAGAVGNLIDRALFGYVVDMIQTLFMDFPVFNVADIYITVGGVLFCVYYIFIHDKVKARERLEAQETTHDDQV